MENLTYTELKTIQSALVYKSVWNDNLTQDEKSDLNSMIGKITLALAIYSDSVEVDGLILENTSGL